jgi:uncharacterized protein YjbI with pentapeptide repeats
VADAKKIDPFDVEALEKSLNDSATRVSTIWISFLIFGLYLLTAATTITHRQLLLAEPVKLPVLNIDLPLWGFFFLAPILFVVFHIYVLLQVLLLGRTAATYNDAIDRAIRPPPSNAAMRQRLANTLFAQIFAGSPRERDGWLGWLLKGMAWITLVIAPVLILFAFQVFFLPYHSHLATWTHRLLILAELGAAFLLWPLVLDARRDLDLTRLKRGLKRLMTFPKRIAVFLLWPLVPKKPWPPVSHKNWNFDWPMHQQQQEFRSLRRLAVPITICLLFVFFSLSLATFPGEPHVNLLNGQSLASVHCNRWLTTKFDRLDVARIGFVDGKELPRIEKDIVDRRLRTYAGERIRNLRGRDLNCASFVYADLRYSEFADASMVGAVFDDASLQGASFGNSILSGSSFVGSKLQGSFLEGAQLQEAALRSAQLQGAFLSDAKLQGSNLNDAQLQGASLSSANLQGASLNNAQLQGASLFNAQLQSASLDRAALHGAYVFAAKFQGASLAPAVLQGADLELSSMTSALLSGVYIWQASNARCQDARVDGRRSGKTIVSRFNYFSSTARILETANDVENFIDSAVADIRDATVRQNTHERLVRGLMKNKSDEDIQEIEREWADCETQSDKETFAEFSDNRAKLIAKQICESKENGTSIAKGVIRNWLSVRRRSIFDFVATSHFDTTRRTDREFAVYLSKALVAEIINGCTSLRDLDEPTKERIRNTAADGGTDDSRLEPPNNLIPLLRDF